MRIQTQHVAEALNALATATPAEIDAVLFPLMGERARTEQSLARMQYMESQGARTMVSVETLGAHLLVLDEKIATLEAVFDVRGGWTRAYKVTNTGGHIHRSTSCNTCFPTTQFALVALVSGMDEAEIVALAGEAACTVCYPSAPVDTLKQKCMLFTEEEIEAKATKDAEKASRKAAKAAKAITNPDGTPLRVHSVCGAIETEVTAQRTYVELTVDATAGYYERSAPGFGEEAEVILTALAHKRGTSVEEQRYLLADKVIAKAKRDGSPRAVTAAKLVKTHYLQKTALQDQA